MSAALFAADAATCVDHAHATEARIGRRDSFEATVQRVNSAGLKIDQGWIGGKHRQPEEMLLKL